MPCWAVMDRSLAVVGCDEPPTRPEPVRTLPRTVADVLNDHVVFEVECIDRMYCNLYVPQLQYAGGLLGYIRRQLGLPIASTAPLGKITDGSARRCAGLPATTTCRGWSSSRASVRTS